MIQNPAIQGGGGNSVEAFERDAINYLKTKGQVRVFDNIDHNTIVVGASGDTPLYNDRYGLVYFETEDGKKQDFYPWIVHSIEGPPYITFCALSFLEVKVRGGGAHSYEFEVSALSQSVSFRMYVLPEASIRVY